MQKSFFLPKWGADPLYPLTKSCVKSKIKYIEKRKKEKYLFKEFPDEKKNLYSFPEIIKQNSSMHCNL